MPNTTNNGAPLKKIKDFNDEEKAAILARANKIELPRVAKEFGTTWQVVSAIQRAAKNAKNAKKSKSKAAPKKAAPAKKAKAAKAAPKSASSSSKKAARTSDEKRLAILQRASEIGVTQAAAEAGVSKWTVFQWRKLMKKAGHEVPKAARVRSTTGKKAAAKAAPKNVKTAMPAMPAKKNGTYSQLELENEMLKQQVANLTAQVEKLRAAVSQLA